MQSVKFIIVASVLVYQKWHSIRHLSSSMLGGIYLSQFERMLAKNVLKIKTLTPRFRQQSRQKRVLVPNIQEKPKEAKVWFSTLLWAAFQFQPKNHFHPMWPPSPFLLMAARLRTWMWKLFFSKQSLGYVIDVGRCCCGKSNSG